MNFDNTYARIDLDVIANNFDAICQKAGKPVMAVVKANAYGHGAIPVARLLEEKCAFFGVASILEALELRKAGIHLPKPFPQRSKTTSGPRSSVMRTR